MADKTKKMIMVEQQWNERLETLLPKMVTARGLTRTAEQLGVSKATLGYWLLKLGINVKRVALAPGDTLTLERYRIAGHEPMRTVITGQAPKVLTCPLCNLPSESGEVHVDCADREQAMADRE